MIKYILIISIYGGGNYIMKKWEINKIDKDLAKELAIDCDIDPFVAMIAASRGYDDPAVLDEFLSDELMFADPFELTDIDKAADCINNAIENDEIIAVYGDYDCDGVTATALMYSYLSYRGAKTIYYIPDRFSEGYGMNKDAIDSLRSKGVSLIVTVDNGISCKEEVEYASSLGIKVVVTDHHLPPVEIPNAEAVVDPHRIDDNSNFKDICGVGVAFKVVCACEGAMPEELISTYGDLVAIGTIGDVMPLVDENRSFVKAGFPLIKEGRRIGIKALINAAGIDNALFNVSRISFGLVPRINAAGRMGSAARAFKLLIEEDEQEAKRLAEEISGENSTRQEIEKQIFEEAEAIINASKLNLHRVIVVAGENWHHGIVGIVASRICERYGKPAIVLSIDGDVAHGSGRSIEGFSLYDSINFASEYTEKFGGHAQAAGMTIKKENIEVFRSAVNEYAMNNQPVVPVLKLDCKLNPAALSMDLVSSLEVLQPFGFGNPTPVFGLFAVEVEKITAVGSGKHLKISFIKGPVAFQAMLFSVAEKEFPFKTGDVLDIAVGLDVNNFNGKEYLSIQIKDYRLSGINDSDLAMQISSYDDFCRLVPGNYSFMAPTREECGMVYKYILHNSYLSANVTQRFMNNLGYAKTNVIIDILSELELIKRSSFCDTEELSVINIGNKVNLENSSILSRVRG